MEKYNLILAITDEEGKEIVRNIVAGGTFKFLTNKNEIIAKQILPDMFNNIISEMKKNGLK
jgi:hypothetical protein